LILILQFFKKKVKSVPLKTSYKKSASSMLLQHMQKIPNKPKTKFLTVFQAWITWVQKCDCSCFSVSKVVMHWYPAWKSRCSLFFPHDRICLHMESRTKISWSSTGLGFFPSYMLIVYICCSLNSKHWNAESL